MDLPYHGAFMDRRLLLAALGAFAFEATAAGAAAEEVGANAAIDNAAASLMAKYDLPGLGLAIVFNSRVLYSKGYGFADSELRTPFTGTTLCRIGSVTKPITNAAILQLIDQGKLKVDDIALRRISAEIHAEAVKVDPRYNEVTVVGHLLTMTGGFGKRPDPMLSADAARDLGLKFPVRGLDYLRWVLRRPLEHPPGERAEYDSTGHLILSRLIEAITGKSFEGGIREVLMEPLGIKSFRVAGSRRQDKLPGECTYYTGFRGRSLWPSPPTEDDYCYTLDVTNSDGAGALVSSAVDLARFTESYGRGAVIAAGRLREYFKKRPPSESGLAGWSVAYGPTGEAQLFNVIGAVLGGSSAFAEYKGRCGIAMVTNHYTKDGVPFLNVESVISRELRF
jgi:N-acyl-D-amino-acid deacylase